MKTIFPCTDEHNCFNPLKSVVPFLLLFSFSCFFKIGYLTAQCPALTPITLPFLEDFSEKDTTLMANEILCEGDRAWKNTYEFVEFGADYTFDNEHEELLVLVSGFDPSNTNKLTLTLDMSSYTSVSGIFLSFDFVNVNFGEATKDSVWIRGNNAESWIGIYEWNQTNDFLWQSSPDFAISTLLSGAGQSFGTTFQVRFGRGGNTTFPFSETLLDNIRLAGCPEPNLLTATNITATTTTLAWTETGSATAWELEWGIEGFAQGSGVLVNNLMTNQYNLSDLVANTNYSFYVRSICAGPPKWEGPYSFSTICPTQIPISLPFLEDFENTVDTTLVSDSDLCFVDKSWTFETNAGGAKLGANAPANNGGTGALLLESDQWGSNSITLNLDMSNYVDATAVFLSFDYLMDFELGSNDSVWIRGSNDDNWIGIYQWSPINAGNWITSVDLEVGEALVNAEQSFSNNFQIRFGRGGKYTFGSLGLLLDNIRLTTCPKPSNPMPTQVTQTSVVLEWMDLGNTTSWDVEWGADGFMSGNGTLVQDLAENTYEISNLLPNTAYNFYVKSNCDTGYSNWIGPIPFTTLCEVSTPITLPFVEGFENSTNTTFTTSNQICLPSNSWLYETTGGVVRFGTDAESSNDGTGALQVENYPYGTSTNDVLLTLDMSSYIGDTNIFISFDSYNAYSEDIPNDTIWVRGNQTDDWLVLYNWEGQAKNTWISSLELDIDMVLAKAGQSFSDNFQIRFGQNGQLNAHFDGWIIDNIFIGSCAKPIDLTVNNTTASTVDLEWKEAGNATIWDIEFGGKGFFKGSGLKIFGVDTNYHQLVNLIPATAYDYYVRANCGETTSEWSGPYTFITNCATNGPINLPFLEDFEAIAAVTLTTSSKVCKEAINWSFETNTGRARFGTNAPLNNGGTGALLLEGTNNANINNAILTADMTNYIGTPNVFLSFDFYETYDNEDPNDSIWVRGSHLENWIGLYNWQGQTERVWRTTPEFDIAAVLTNAGQSFSSTFQLRFGQQGYASYNSDGLIIDNILISNCSKPNDLAVKNIAAHSADLSWNTRGVTTTWEIEWGLKGFLQGNGVKIANIDTNAYTLINLLPATSFDFYVRSNCGGHATAWTGPFTFNTFCASTGPNDLPFIEDFENITNDIFLNNVQLCFEDRRWDYETARGRAYFGSEALINNGGSGALLLDGQSNGSNKHSAILTLDMSNHTAATDLFLTFDFYDVFDGQHDYDSIWIRGNHTNEWIGLYDWQGQVENTWITTPELDLDSTLVNAGQHFSTTFQIRFGQEGYYRYNNDGLAIDNIYVGTCSKPDTLRVTNEGETSVELGWTEMGTATSWQIEYGHQGYTQGNGNLLTDVTTNPFTLSNLTTNTFYDFYVQSSCDGVSSLWAGPFTFSTLCPASTPITIPFLVDFEDIPATTLSTNGFICGSTTNWKFETSSGRGRFGSNAPINNGGSGALLLDGNFANNINEAVLTLDMSNYTGATDLLLSYDLYDFNDHSDFDNSIYIRGSDADTWVKIYQSDGYIFQDWKTMAELDLDLALKNAEQDFSNTFQIRFVQEGYYSYSREGLGIDNIQIGTCLKPDALTVTGITSNSANLHWTEKGIATNWDIEWGPEGFTQNEGTLLSAINTNPYVLQNLAAGSFYDFYVRANCEGETSSWVGPFTFATFCPSFNSISLPFIEDFENTTNITLTKDGLACLEDGVWAFRTTGGRAQFGTHADLNNGGTGALLLDNPGGTSTNYAVLKLDMSNYVEVTNMWLTFDFFDASDETNFNDKVWVRGSDSNVWLEVFNWSGNEEDVWITTPQIDIGAALVNGGQTFSNSFQIQFGQEDNSSFNSDGLIIDNLILSTCPSPSNLNAINISDTTANLTWTTLAISQNWEIEWDTAGFSQGTGTLLPNIDTNVYHLSGLTTGTSYDFYVRSNCDINNSSAWIGPFTFKTIQIYPTNYSENFENFTLDFDWEGRFQVGTVLNNFSNVIFDALSDGNDLTVISPQIGPIKDGDWLSFYYQYADVNASNLTTLGIGDTLNVQISTDGGVSYTTIDQIHAGNYEPTTGMTQLDYNLSEYDGEVIKIRIFAEHGIGFYFLAMDNFFVGAANLRITDASILEGPQESTDYLMFPVTLDTFYSNIITVDYTSIDSTATLQDNDYEETKGQLVFFPGDMTREILVPIKGDDRQEMEEIMKLQLSNPSLARVTRSLGIGFITDDDFPAPSPANANEDQLNICGTTAQLNAILNETDSPMGWQIISGTGGILADELFEQTTFTGMIGETYKLEWSIISNPSGEIFSDTMMVSFNPDTDNDGVQDCQDICPGQDDTIDTDADTQPDACDCNPNDASDSLTVVTNNHPSNKIADSTYQSSVRLTGTGNIKNGSTVIFKAGQEILLMPGFYAEAGSDFHGLIAACHPIESVAKPISITANSRQTKQEIDRSEVVKSAATLQMRIQPNLIKNRAIIQIDLPKSTPIALSLYNANGQQVQVYLEDTYLEEGRHELSFNRGNLPVGIYFLQLRSEVGIITKKLLVQQ